jgi:hypothetical protein
MIKLNSTQLNSICMISFPWVASGHACKCRGIEVVLEDHSPAEPTGGELNQTACLGWSSQLQPVVMDRGKTLLQV